MLKDIESMTLAEQMQLKRELEKRLKRPEIRFQCWVEDLMFKWKEQLRNRLLSHPLVASLFPRLHRLHQLNNFAFEMVCVMTINGQYDSVECQRWNRFSNRLHRLTGKHSPWYD